MKFKRVYHPIDQWEEMRTAMWLTCDKPDEMLVRAVEFTGQWQLYASWMERVIHDWPISCENSLTDYRINRKAWLGHAACAMAINCPEKITRQAWGMLSDAQRRLANREAERFIRQWENDYAKSLGIRKPLAQPLLF
jgi:hypothetical protein